MAQDGMVNLLELDPNVTMEQVLGLLDWMGEHSAETVDAGRLSHDSKFDADLSPVLTISQKLGLVNLQDETVK